MPRLLGFILLLGALTVCGCQPKVDGSSEEAMKASVEKIKKSLDADKAQKFETAMAVVMMHNVNASAMGNPEAAQKQVLASVNGKTADQIIAEADKIRADSKTKSGVPGMP